MKSILAQDNHNSEFIKQCSPTKLSVTVTLLYTTWIQTYVLYILFPTCLPSVVSQLGFSQFFFWVLFAV